MSNKPSVLKIGQAAKALGVSVKTLRRWETAGKISSVRTPGGTRLYSLEEIQNRQSQPPQKAPQAALSLNEAAEKLGVSARTLRRWEEIGRISFQKDASGKIFCSPQDVRNLLQTTSKGISAAPAVAPVITPAAAPVSPTAPYASMPVPSQAPQTLYTKLSHFRFISTIAFSSSLVLVLLTTVLIALYLISPQTAAQLIKNNPAVGLLSPVNKLALETASIISPEAKQELANLQPPSPPPNAVFNIPNTTSPLPAATPAGSAYLDIDTKTRITGSLSVSDTINDLKIEATPSANTLALASGDTSLTVTNNALIDQDVSTSSSPAFAGLNLSARSNQLVFQSGGSGAAGTLTWTPTSAAKTITLPDATGTVVLDSNTQALTNKTISGSSNTFTNIPASAITGSGKITVSAGTNLSGGGEITWGESTTISLKDAVGLANGSASAPAYSFSSDTDSGLYRIGTNNIALITGGSSTHGISINSDGNVGVGTLTPGYKLEVNGSLNATTLLQNGQPISGAISVQGINGTPVTVSSVQTLQFDQATGLHVTDMGSNTAKISIGSHWYTIYLNGTPTLTPTSEENINFISGSNFSITGSSITSPQSLTFAVSSTPTFTSLTSGNVGIGYTGYLNFSTPTGSTGYGLRDNLGTMQYKNSGGSWANMGTGTGSSVWSGLTAPTDNLALSMSAYTTTFTWGSATGASNLLSLTDTISNTGTGYLLDLTTASSSTLNPLHISAAGTEALTVTKTGNVGIGTTNPGTLLQTYLAGSNSVENRITNGSGSLRLIQYWDGSSRIYSTGSNTLQLGTNETTNMTINSSGNLGIGTTNPGAKLEVNGKLSITGSYAPTTGQNGLHFGFSGNTGRIIAIQEGTAFRDLKIDAANLLFQTTTGAGNLGIGTTNPGGILDVAIPSDGAMYLGQGSIASTVQFTNGKIISNSGRFQISGRARDGTNTPITFLTNNGVEQMRIDNSGNVGIGTALPTAAFQVNSTGSNPFVVQSGGNAGIGTTNPLSKLVINDSVLGNNINMLYPTPNDYGLDANASLQTIVGGNDSVGQDAGLAFRNEQSNRKWILGLDSSDSDLFSIALDNFSTGQKLSINTNGNVGIGTTKAGYKLEVQEAKTGQQEAVIARFRLQRNDNSAADKMLDIFADTTEGWTTAITGLNASSEGGVTPSLQLRVANVPYMTISADASNNRTGFVGIGTTGPAANLHVLGTSAALANSTTGIAFIGAGPSKLQFGYDNSTTNGYGWIAATKNTSTWSDLVLIPNTNGAIGNVGIGTTAPGFKLDVAGGIRSYTPNAHSSIAQISSGGVTWQWNTFNTNDLKLRNNAATGTDVLTLLSNGNVGIGTTGPLYKLSVAGNIGTFDSNNQVRFFIYQDGSGIGSVNGTSFTIQANHSNNVPIIFSGPTQERMRIDGNGNMGIGTTNPGYKLEVAGSGLFGDTTNGGALWFQGKTATSYATLFSNTASNFSISQANTDTRYVNINSTGVGGSLGLLVQGNVGIGTTNPASKLELVNGAFNMTSTTNGSNVLFQINAPNSSGQNKIFQLTSNPNAGTLTFDTGGSGTEQALIFSNINEKFRLDNNGSYFSNGNVGIGTTGPWSALSVNGAIRSGTDSTHYGGLTFTGSDLSISTYNYTLPVKFNGSALYVGSVTENGNVGIGTILPTAAFQVNATNSNPFVVQSGGNVGIGTTNPLSTLYVNGDAQIARNGSNVSLYLVNTGTGGGSFRFIAGETGDPMAGGLGLYDNTASAYRLAINSSGNVGIGAVAPGATLHVNGNAMIGYASGATPASLANGLAVSGNVGIGTTGPRTKLHIDETATRTSFTGTGFGTALIRNQAGNSNYTALDFSNNASLSNPQARIASLQTASGSYLSFGTSNGYASGITNTAMTIDYAGNIGIGTALPTATFQVNSTSSNPFVVQSGGNVGIGTTSPGATLSVFSPTNSPTAYFNGNSNGYYPGQGSGLAIATNFSAGNAETDIWNTTNPSTYPNTGIRFLQQTGASSYTDLMFLKNNGNIGIGTTSPRFRLEIAGTNLPFQVTNANGGNQINIVSNPASVATLSLGNTTLATVGRIQYDNSINTLEVFTNSTERLRVDGSGNVGIGTILPTATFQVNSTGSNPFVVQSGGNVGIGTTNPSTQLEVYAPTASDATFALSNQDVVSPFTSVASANTYFKLNSISPTSGGAQLTGLSSTDAQGLEIRGLIGSVNPNQWTPAIKIVAAESNGLGGVSAVGTLNPIFQVQNNTNEPAFTIRGNGSVGIGATAPGSMLQVGRTGNTGNITVYGTSTTCTIGNGTGATNCSSDIRLKENVNNLDSELGNILNLRPVTFNWIDKTKDQSQNLGFIAQEVQKVFPQFVHPLPDGYLGLDYAALVVPAIKAIQQQQVQIASNSALLANVSVDSLGNLTVPAVKMDKLLIAASDTSTTFSAGTSSALTSNGTSLLFTNINNIASTVLTNNSQAYLDLTNKVDSLASQGQALQTQMANLEDKIASLSAQVAGIASSSAQTATSSAAATSSASIATPSATASPSGTLALTPPQILLATSSAQITNLTVTSSATISGQLTAYSATIQDTFKSLGKSFLGQTTIAGDFTQDGTLSITGGNTLNVLGTLYIQNSLLAGPVNFFNGLVTIDNQGNIKAQSISAGEYLGVAGKVTGSGTIPAGSTFVDIPNTVVKANSRIMVTVTNDTSLVLRVTGKAAGEKFTVSVAYPTLSDITFDWFVINETPN